MTARRDQLTREIAAELKRLRREHRTQAPTGHDRIKAAAVNMRRGPVGPNGADWPQRGRLALASLEARDVDVAGWSEFPSRAVPIFHDADGVRLSRAAANYVGAHEKIGNAISWGHGTAELRLRDGGRITSLPFIDHPHGLTRLSQPVRLFRTAHGGAVVVIQLHPPIVSNVDPPRGVDGPRGKAYAQLVRATLIDDTLEVVLDCLRAGIPVLVVGDFNKLRGDLIAAGAELGAACDVQGVLAFGLEFTSSGVDRKSRGAFTDHSGYPWATAPVPYYEGRPFPTLPRRAA